MATMNKPVKGNAAQLTRSSRGIGALIVQHLAADGADLASVFVTNGGYNGVQQVLRLSTSLSPKPHQIKPRRTPESER